MMHTTQNIYDQLTQQLAQINRQIAAITDNFEKRNEVSPYPHLHTVYGEVDRNGRPILEPMISAKAQVLSAMAALKTAELQGKAGPTRAGKSWG